MSINMMSLGISILKHCSQNVFISVLDYWQCKLRVPSISLILYGAGCFFNSVRSSNVFNPSLGKPMVTCSGTPPYIKFYLLKIFSGIIFGLKIPLTKI
jgi:hypothetical protein